MTIVSPDPCEPITAEQRAALRAAYPSASRVMVAMRLARDVETFRALYAGEPVDPARVDPAGHTWARNRRLVQLDLHAIDLLDVREAA